MGATARMPALQSLLHGGQQGLAFQYGVALPHPVLPQLLHRFLDEALAETTLRLAEINHAYASCWVVDAWARAATPAD